MSATDNLGRQWNHGYADIARVQDTEVFSRVANSVARHRPDDWEHIEPEHVDVGSLRPTQHFLSEDAYHAVAHDDRPIRVVQYAGKSYVYDGHHRWARAQDSGARTIKAKVMR